MENIVRLVDYRDTGCPNCHGKIHNLELKAEMMTGLKIVCPYCGADLQLFSDIAISTRLSKRLKTIIQDLESLSVVSSKLTLFQQLYEINYHALDFQNVLDFIAENNIKTTDLDEILMGHLVIPSEISAVKVMAKSGEGNVVNLTLAADLAKEALLMLNRISYSYYKQHSVPNFTFTNLANASVITIYFHEDECRDIFFRLLEHNDNLLTESIIRSALNKESSFLNTLVRERTA